MAISKLPADVWDLENGKHNLYSEQKTLTDDVIKNIAGSKVWATYYGKNNKIVGWNISFTNDQLPKIKKLLAAKK